MYSVVKFVESDTVTLVPSSWISDDKKTCKWPPGPARGLIKKRKDADRTWKDYAVKVFKRKTGI